MMLSGQISQKDGLKLRGVIKKPPLKVEVWLGVLCSFMSSCEDFKRTNQLQV